MGPAGRAWAEDARLQDCPLRAGPRVTTVSVGWRGQSNYVVLGWGQGAWIGERGCVRRARASRPGVEVGSPQEVPAGRPSPVLVWGGEAGDARSVSVSIGCVPTQPQGPRLPAGPGPCAWHPPLAFRSFPPWTLSSVICVPGTSPRLSASVCRVLAWVSG